jgi:hypothetical protein
MSKNLFLVICICLVCACSSKSHAVNADRINDNDSFCAKTNAFLKNVVEQQKSLIDSLQQELARQNMVQR